MSNIVTISDFARIKGCTVEAVSKAIKAGRLKDAVIRGMGRYPKLDADIAEREWAQNTRPRTHDIDDRPAPTDAVGDPAAIGASYAESRAKREAYEAELARLKVQKELEQLVDADEVKRAAFRVARQVRDGLLNIPDRIAAELAAETDAFAVHRMLTDEIRKVLSDTALAVEGGDNG